MAGSLNKVTLIGYLGQDPEVRTFQNGGKVVILRISTTEHWRDRQTNERRERTEWHTVAIHAEALQKKAEQYLRKGSSVYVEGALETRKWQDQSGNDRYSTEVTLRAYRGELQMLDPRPQNSQPQNDAGGSGDGAGGRSAGNAQRRPEADHGNGRQSADSRSYGTGPNRNDSRPNQGRGQSRDQGYQRQDQGRGQQQDRSPAYSDNGPTSNTSHQRNAY